MARNQAYEVRGVIGKLGRVGNYQYGSVLVQLPIYKYLTLDCGPNKESVPVEFVRQAPFINDEAGTPHLNIKALKEGEFVVSPGFVYKRCKWFGQLYTAHLKALQNYKRKDIIMAEKADAPPIDLGTIDATTDQVTKH